FAGRRLRKESWDDVQSIRGAVALKRDGQWLLATPAQLARAANLEAIDFKGPFTEVRSTLSGIWVRNDDEEGLLDATLAELIPVARQTITEKEFGAVIKSVAGEQIYITGGRLSPLFQKVKASDPWMAVRQSSRWHLYDPAQMTVASPAYDTLVFYGPFAAGINADSTTVFFTTEKRLDFVNAQFEFVPGKSAAYFLLVTRDKSKMLFDKSGNKLFDVTYESIQYLDRGFFLISKKGRHGVDKGVINVEGKLVVPMDYDAAGNYSEGKLPVLKNMKFGLTDLANNKTIKPQYDKNLISYNATFVVAYKGGRYGFITWDSKPHTEFEFDEVKPWNDSTALVKKDSQWMLLDIAHREVLMDRIRHYRVVRDDADEKVLIVIQDNHFGVISNRHGTVIPATFSDIINIGSPEKPFYFTEKHVEEASLFVVIYYDAAGKYITRQTYEPDDYDRIYCSRK
ncbi:MAG: WG repeat-containing protein, partial [Bacteroidia bacterium]|nr:WG repeat-containing protein [Bacteroidia bacterium]